MSMILSGNLIERFGPQLPTPQVEQIRVHEDKIEIDLSLYFLLSGDDSGGAQKNQIESDLAELNVYACLVYGEPYAESVILGGSNVFGELYEGASTSGMSASYLKGAAETGMFTTGIDYTTDEAKAIMLEAGWDFDGDGEYIPGNDVQVWLDYASDSYYQDPNQWYDFVSLAVTSDSIPDIPDAWNYDDGTTKYTTGLDWAVAQWARLFDDGYIDRLSELTGTINYIHDPDSVIVDNSPNYSSIQFGDTSTWVLGDDLISDGFGNSILKYGATYTITPDFSSFPAPFSLDMNSNIFNAMSEGLNAYFEKTLTLLTFSSFVNYSNAVADTAYTDNNTGIIFEPSEQLSDYRNFINYKPNTQLPLSLFDVQTSDISYRTIFKNGLLHIEPQSYYVYKGTNEIYDGIPIQSITGKYYDAGGLSKEQLNVNIETVIKSFGGGNAGVPGVDELVASLAMVVFDNMLSPKILKELDIYRRSFPDKTTQLYDAVKNLVSRNNRLLKTGREVVKTLYSNNILVDMRDDLSSLVFQSGSYVETEIFPIYNQNAFISSEVKLGNVSDDEDLEMPVVTTGYFFFDQEMALKYKSNLSRVFDVSYVEDIFGKELTNLSFYVRSAAVKKYIIPTGKTFEEVSSEDFGERIFNLFYDNTFPQGPSQQLAAFAEGNILLEKDDVGYTAVFDSTENFAMVSPGDILYTYIIPRAWDLKINSVFTGSARTYSSTSNGLSYSMTASGPASEYRMQCFEFQEISSIKADDESPNSQYMYSFEVQVEDNTLEVVNYLTASYYNALMGFEEYRGYAEEHCSYNNLEGRFNNFFTEGIKTIYSGSLYESAWFQAAASYHTHLDFLTAVHDNNRDSIIAAAKGTVALVNPINGTLENVRAFHDQMQLLYDLYYNGNESIIGEIVDGLSSNDIQIYPTSRDPFDASCPLPDLSITYDIISDAIDENWSQRWENLVNLLYGYMDNLTTIARSGLNQTVRINFKLSSGDEASTSEEVPLWSLYFDSVDSVFLWLENGAPDFGEIASSDELASMAANFAPNNTSFMKAAQGVLLCLDSIRRFCIFGLEDKNGEEYAVETLRVLRLINEAFMSNFLSEAAGVYVSMSETISKSLLDFMSQIYLDRLTEIGEVQISEVSWSPSWPIMRSTSVYDLFQPLTDGDGLSTNTSDILEELEDINFNLTEAWNQANGWDKVGEGTNFSTWFLNWIYDAGYDLSDIA